MLFHYGAVGVFLLVSIAFVVGSLLAGMAVRSSRYSKEKASIYECGEPTIGSAWVRYNVRFYIIALVYLVFDVETVFLFPVASVLKRFKEAGLGALAFFEIAFFVAILAVGLAYAWRYGALNWVRDEEKAEVAPGEAL
ncbi:MAG: NAD(P)H-quinone oxidoreductase subunit 3 [candidate division BRC1 bacterium ADurb.BinA364]|nr:MAG: NAD(P)H-quinone oxidoreductase subunit 3 [candidate division BRC1 bacterium ADurb.BinA364]